MYSFNWYNIFIIILLFRPFDAIKSKDCPEICICLGMYVDCASKKLENVPSNLPKWSTHLDLHNNAIRRLNDSVWRNLTNLTGVNLSKNEIGAITHGAFNHQKYLRQLEINRNRLRYIDALTFKSLENLTVLRLKRNQIVQLKDGAFYGLMALEKLFLDYNYVQVISKGWLYGLRMLKELSLNHNNINRIENDAWESCQDLNILDLSYNELKFINHGTFKYLQALQKLLLNNNNITFIEENAFDYLPNLKVLNLNNNKISWTVEDANGVFRGLINLQKFSLVNNEIKSINRNAFVGLKSLTYLNLTLNNVTTIQKNAFIEIPLLTDLIMNTTNLLCDCNLNWFADWLDARQYLNVSVKCAYPDWLNGVPLNNVPSTNFTCDELPKPRLIEQPEPEIMALKGENVSLSCTAMSSSDSPMSFHWKKDNVEIPYDSIVTKISDTAGAKTIVSTLNLYHVLHGNAGKYQCVVSNNFGSTYSQKSDISVLIFPTFEKIPANVTVKVGATAKLECAAHGEPQPEIAWQKDGGNNFPAARERRMHVMPNDVVFFIIDVKPSDMGVYSCTAHNAAGTIVANATLTVEEPPSFVKLMEDKEVPMGKLIVIECMASGVPKPFITWTKDGEALKSTERHFFTAEDQLLIIVDTLQEDGGVYGCHLNNSLGWVSGFSRLKVVVGPSATSNVWGVVIISVVFCAVGTSILWFVIIYHTRRHVTRSTGINTHSDDGDLTEIAANLRGHDNNSEDSSCKDSGTGDCGAKRSNENLTVDDFTLTLNAAQSRCRALRTASLLYLANECGEAAVGSGYNAVLLHTDDMCTCLRRDDDGDEVKGHVD